MKFIITLLLLLAPVALATWAMNNTVWGLIHIPDPSGLVLAAWVGLVLSGVSCIWWRK